MRFHSEDMTCGGCVRAIERAVSAVDPAARLTADLDHRLVEIDSALPRARIAAAIEAAGFRLSPEQE